LKTAISVAIERKIRLPEVERLGGLLKQMLAGFEGRRGGC
jgi:hypothetical protein